MLRFIYHKEYKILKKITRVVETMVVNFYIVNVTYCFFGNTIRYNLKKLKTDYDIKKVPSEDQYRITMAIKSIGYLILSQEWKLMIRHTDENGNEI